MEKTLENLSKAFIGESQARNRYTFYAKTALKEGYPQISELFLLTAKNEAQHAKWLMRLINQLLEKKGEKGKSIIVEAEAPTVLATTAENLQAAIDGENYERTTMYPEFAKVAKEEGLDDISKRLFAIANAETHHEERYIKLLAQVKNNTMFEKTEEKEWVCAECGYVHRGTKPPEKCPSCDHPTKYFSLKCEAY